MDGACFACPFLKVYNDYFVGEKIATTQQRLALFIIASRETKAKAMKTKSKNKNDEKKNENKNRRKDNNNNIAGNLSQSSTYNKLNVDHSVVSIFYHQRALYN